MRQWSVRTQVICIVPAVAITAYGAYAFWGPYRWIAQLQLRWFGAYEQKITLIFTLLAIAVAMWPIALLLERREAAERSPGVGGVRGTTPRGVGGDASDLGERVVEFFARIQPHLHTRSGQAVLVGLGLLGFAAYSGAVAYRAGSSVTLSADQADVAAADHLGKTVVLRGRPVPEADNVWERNHVDAHYVPFVSERWETGQPVRVVVLATGIRATSELRGPDFVGIADPMGLPSDVRSEWRASDAPLAADVLVVELGETSGHKLALSAILGVVGGLSAVIGYAIARRRVG
jgi:hypothetical protein